MVIRFHDDVMMSATPFFCSLSHSAGYCSWHVLPWPDDLMFGPQKIPPKYPKNFHMLTVSAMAQNIEIPRNAMHLLVPTSCASRENLGCDFVGSVFHGHFCFVSPLIAGLTQSPSAPAPSPPREMRNPMS